MKSEKTIGIVGLHGIPGRPDISRRIYQQSIFLLKATSPSLSHQQEGIVLDVTMACIYKLGAIIYHNGRFNSEWNRSLKRFMRRKNKNVLEEQTLLAYEFEAFVFQVKSCLDAMAKILALFVQDPPVTYGDDGKDVLKFLENCIPQKFQPRTAKLRTLVTQGIPWISYMVKLRDELNHHLRNTKGLRSFFFQLSSANSLIPAIIAPKVYDGKDALQIVTDTAVKILLFVEDFLGFAIYIVMHPALELILSNNPNATGKWIVKLSESTGQKCNCLC